MTVRRTDIPIERETHRATDRRTDRQAIGQTYQQRVERDHRKRTFASLYTIIKNKIGNIF